jgi:two-component system chemotaxis response regulator CheY
MKVIVVDDSATVRMIIRMHLVAQGFDSILEAKDGQHALDLIKAGGTAPDLALVDWNMPVMSGLELVKAVRQLPALQTMRILMVTSESEEKVQMALAAGAHGHITKPFTVEKLEDQLGRIGFTLRATG